MGIEEETSSIKKRKGKVQGSPDEFVATSCTPLMTISSLMALNCWEFVVHSEAVCLIKHSKPET